MKWNDKSFKDRAVRVLQFSLTAWFATEFVFWGLYLCVIRRETSFAEFMYIVSPEKALLALFRS